MRSAEAHPCEWNRDSVSRVPVHYAVLALCVLGLLPRAPSEAAPARRYLLGLPWETPIVEGIESQNRAQRRRKPLDAMVNTYTRRARRNQTVDNLYLLGRAYGLRFTEARTLASKSQSAAARERLEAKAARDLASAQSTYRDALKADGRCYFAYHDLGVLELKRKRRSKRAAYDQFVRALQINGRYVDAVRKLVLLYLEGDQYDLAAQQLRRLLRLEPDDTIARTQLVAALTKLSLYDDALRQLDALLAAKPRHAPYLDLKAQVLAKQHRYDEALALYRDIARANPSVPTAFVGMLRTLQEQKKADPGASPRFDDFLFALRGLHRLERDPTRRAKIEEDIAQLEAVQHQPARAPNRPITAEDVLAVLAASPNEEDRARAIYFFLSREEPVTPRILKAIAKHLAEATEPATRVRILAVRALGHVGGTAVSGMVRLSLNDRDASVRAAAVDTLARIAARDPTAASALSVVLGLVVDDRDVGVSAAAREAILRIHDERLHVPADAPARAHAAAFRAWWQGDVGTDRLATGLGRVPTLPDKFPEDVLLAYLDHDAMLVGRAAYEALSRVEAPPGSTRATWLAARPRFADEAWKQESWEDVRNALRSWSRRRPQ